MDVTDVKGLFAEIRKRMDGQIDFVRKELAGVRTGRANTGLLNSVHVDDDRGAAVRSHAHGGH